MPALISNVNLGVHERSGQRESTTSKIKKCDQCKQFSSNIKTFTIEKDLCTEEYIAITDQSLCVQHDEHANDDNGDGFYNSQQQYKLTNFAIYDKYNHICSIDGGLIEKNIELYFSGSLKPIYDEDSTTLNGFEVKDIGPINAWWITGFDGGEIILVGLTTAYADYYLMTPHPEYTHVYEKMLEKIFLSKIVMEFLLDHQNDGMNDQENTYADLVTAICTAVPPPIKGIKCGIIPPNFTEEYLLKHAQFIIEQVQSYDEFAETYDALLIFSPCLQTLIEFVGADVVKYSKKLSNYHQSGTSHLPKYSAGGSYAKNNIVNVRGRKRRLHLYGDECDDDGDVIYRPRKSSKAPQSNSGYAPWHQILQNRKESTTALSEHQACVVTPLVKSVFDALFSEQMDSCTPRGPDRPEPETADTTEGPNPPDTERVPNDGTAVVTVTSKADGSVMVEGSNAVSGSDYGACAPESNAFRFGHQNKKRRSNTTTSGISHDSSLGTAPAQGSDSEELDEPEPAPSSAAAEDRAVEQNGGSCQTLRSFLGQIPSMAAAAVVYLNPGLLLSGKAKTCAISRLDYLLEDEMVERDKDLTDTGPGHTFRRKVFRKLKAYEKVTRHTRCEVDAVHEIKFELQTGDFVIIISDLDRNETGGGQVSEDGDLPDTSYTILRICNISLLQSNQKVKDSSGTEGDGPTFITIHGIKYLRASETILAETALPKELFPVYECCEDVTLSDVYCKLPDIIYQGGQMINGILDSDRNLFYRKLYDSVMARYEDVPSSMFKAFMPPSDPGKDGNDDYGQCPACKYINEENLRDVPTYGPKTQSYSSQDANYAIPDSVQVCLGGASNILSYHDWIDCKGDRYSLHDHVLIDPYRLCNQNDDEVANETFKKVDMEVVITPQSPLAKDDVNSIIGPGLEEEPDPRTEESKEEPESRTTVPVEMSRETSGALRKCGPQNGTVGGSHFLMGRRKVKMTSPVDENIPRTDTTPLKKYELRKKTPAKAYKDDGLDVLKISSSDFGSIHDIWKLGIPEASLTTEDPKKYDGEVHQNLVAPVNLTRHATMGTHQDTYIEDGTADDMYPELYRKRSQNTTTADNECPKPFVVGKLLTWVRTKVAIFAPLSHQGHSLKRDEEEATGCPNLYALCSRYYRPEETTTGINSDTISDFSLLYWSSDVIVVDMAAIFGKCLVTHNASDDTRTHITPSTSIASKSSCYADEFCSLLPRHDGTLHYFPKFYYQQGYDISLRKLTRLPMNLVITGQNGTGNEKTKSTKSNSIKPQAIQEVSDVPKKFLPLRCLDIFAGCGGLSEGLHNSGVAKTLWAIENDLKAANAFRLNNPLATVYTQSCSHLLKLIIAGKLVNEIGQKLPRPIDDEVELLCGGPPCQGFSGMNRFNYGDCSKFKNSLIATMLSYCEIYRPKYFLLENVKNFLHYKAGSVLKLTLTCLVQMGYQCTFGLLQAGTMGVPQSRKRAFIIAARSGLVLPRFPTPTHTFPLRATTTTAVINGQKYINDSTAFHTAPYQRVTIRDSISDLPAIKNGASKELIPYQDIPQSHFQRQMRRGPRGLPTDPTTTVKDHICKEMSALVHARICNIPKKPGADWRDLPNVDLALSDGTMAKKLIYTHNDKKNGKASNGALRGVCQCAEGKGKKCSTEHRQFDTLIPWCLPHTSNRHNQWAGLYGRLDWDSFFSTTVTNPEPMGKQGRILHPQQDRVVGVRECARSQGFPDSYKFYGSVVEKHRQIGNAVPPPLAKEIGKEILKAMITGQRNES